MNRFFSKLDLRDIKIDPEGTRFLPDADDGEQTEPAEESPAMEAVEYVESETESFDADSGWVAAPMDEQAPVSSNHHHPNEYNGVATETVQRTEEGEVLKVSAKSRPSAVAGAIAGVVRENGRAEVQAIGAGATNQAVKAVAIARDYLLETGIEAICLPAFIDVTIDNEDRTAIRLIVEPR
jgi:stage V sporulation protein S